MVRGGLTLPRAERGVKLLLIVLACAMLLQIVLGALFFSEAGRWEREVQPILGLYLPNLLSGMVWQPVTMLLLHSMEGWGHLLMNLLVLYLFGSLLEVRTGTRNMLALFVFAGLLGSAAVVASDGFRLALSHPVVPTLGASGAISGIVGGVCMLWWHRPLHFFFFQAKGWQLLIAILVIDLLRWIAGAPISLAAHVGGLGAGLWWLSSRSPRLLWLRLRLWWTRRRLRVIQGGGGRGAKDRTDA